VVHSVWEAVDEIVYGVRFIEKRDYVAPLMPILPRSAAVTEDFETLVANFRNDVIQEYQKYKTRYGIPTENITDFQSNLDEFAHILEGTTSQEIIEQRPNVADNVDPEVGAPVTSPSRNMNPVDEGDSGAAKPNTRRNVIARYGPWLAMAALYVCGAGAVYFC
jgi:hypothetical protein